MAIPYVNPLASSVPTGEPSDTDLVRRYCPTLTLYTHEQLALFITPDEHGCWPWPGYINRQQYGMVWTPESWEISRNFLSHRYMYTLLVGPIPDGKDVHHRCENKPCWNLFHLQPLTPKEHYEAHHPHLPPIYPCDVRGQFLLFGS